MSDECCYKCKSIERPLVNIKTKNEIGEDIDGWICMKHLFMQVLDAGYKEMHNNMQDYTGVLFDYKDEIQK